MSANGTDTDNAQATRENKYRGKNLKLTNDLLTHPVAIASPDHQQSITDVTVAGEGEGGKTAATHATHSKVIQTIPHSTGGEKQSKHSIDILNQISSSHIPSTHYNEGQ